MSPIGRKHWAILIVIILAIGIAAGYLINNLQKNDTSNGQNGTSEWKEPPALTATLSTKQDYLNDIQSLGCILMESRLHGATYGDVNYTDFRRLAFNSKVVFYSLDVDSEGKILDLCVIYDACVFYTSTRYS